jgi:putative transposase
MARPLRLEVVDGWYHLTARGNNRQVIFRQEGDYRRFVELLSELPDRFGLEVVAYALMPNHYHLLARLRRPGLSRALQWLNLSYSAWCQARHGQSGHLFQGRFHSVLVEGEGAWLLEASLYVHLNPVRVTALGLGKSARAAERRGVLPHPTPDELNARLRALRSFPWSSYRALVGLTERPAWLAGDELLRRAGGPQAYRRQVEARIRQGETEPLSAKVSLGVALGSDAFVERLRGVATGQQVVRREHPRYRQLAPALGLADVIAAVERVKQESLTHFERRHGDPGRDLIWWAARRFAGLPLAELSAASGGVDYSTVSAAVGRLVRRSLTDRKLLRQMQAVEQELSNAKI